MKNYQLYRTNVALSGQMKWDLIVGNNDGELCINGFHLTPISSNIPFNRYLDDNILKHTHQYNVSSLYKAISSSFYKTFIDSRLDNPWPIISDGKIKSYDNQYWRGCRRSSYSRYGEQFEFLCPLWIEKLSGDLSFNISVYSHPNDHTPLATKELKISRTKNQNFHNKFVEYFNNYIKQIKLDAGNDEVLAIYLNKGVARISGINAKSGLNQVIDLPNLVNNLVSRERPVMEFDNMVIQQFESNSMIVQQLFNFNICFNLDDIVNPFILNNLLGKNIYVRVDASIGGERLETRDFFSNYDHIDRPYSGVDYNITSNGFYVNTQEITPVNVYSYMKDNEFIDFIDKNKLIQNTIHWSLNRDNEYIFNVYEGFAGAHCAHIYGTSPDITSSKSTSSNNALNWCTRVSNSVTTKDVFSMLENFVDLYKSDFTKFGYGDRCINHIIYDATTDKDFPFNDVNVAIIHDNTYIAEIGGFEHGALTQAISQRVGDYRCIELTDGSTYLIYMVSIGRTDQSLNTVVFVSRYADNLTFPVILKALRKFFNDNDLDDIYKNYPQIYILYESMLAADVKNLSIITPSTSLDLFRADGPSLSTSEIEYCKNNSKRGTYVLRYSGKLKPTFITGQNWYNNLYKKDVIKEWVGSNYSNYYETGYLPLYPSINYCAYKAEKIDYKRNMLDNGSEYEYTWFDDNLVIYLPLELSFTIESDKQEPMDLITKYVADKYGFDSDKVKYVMNLYDIEYSFDYKITADVERNIYNVKMKLK